jgi:proteasome lid subunit RPN8/RPN11
MGSRNGYPKFWRKLLLRIDKRFADEMVAHSMEEDPNECCGILSGTDGTVQELYRITNTTKSPYTYQMDPQEHLNADLDTERKGMEFVAFYHSHTHSPAYPSDTDVRMALQSGYLEVHYVLVSLKNKAETYIRAYRIDELGNITEDQIEAD